VLEVIEGEKLMENATETGGFLLNELANIPGLLNLRGKGLMIGFDVEEGLKDLRKNLLFNQRVFTGEAKPNVIRLLPSLALRKKEALEFLESLKEEIHHLTTAPNLVSQA
jgi:acetylornithine aminotransferase